MKRQMSIKTVAAAAVLVAMNIILARVFAVNIGPALRITISTTPIFLAGLWFGPLVGALCGAHGGFAGESVPGLCSQSAHYGDCRFMWLCSPDL